MTYKPAILLLNLGSPDSPKVSDVKRYLTEFLNDERVIDGPAWKRWLVVNLLIIPFRKRKSAHSYAQVWTESGSPLVVLSRRQQEALQAALPCPVFLAMRYGNPSIPSVLQDIVKAQVTHLYVVPLYPQYAMSSYETAWVKVTQTLAAMGEPLKVEALPPFYNDPAYIRTLATVMKDHYPQVTAMPDGAYLLFSFHGLPQRHLKVTDPSHAYCLQVPGCCQKPHPAHATCYRHQCYATIQHLAQHLGLHPSQYGVSFQSRLGKEPWLQPYTDHTIEGLAKKGLRQLAVACPAFTTDCLETLEEIAMGCKEAFLEAGGERFDFIPCLNDHPAFIEFLADKAQAWLQRIEAEA